MGVGVGLSFNFWPECRAAAIRLPSRRSPVAPAGRLPQQSGFVPLKIQVPLFKGGFRGIVCMKAALRPDRS